MGPYVIEKVLPNENYIVRKLSSNETQISHRIRLRKYTPNTELRAVRPEGNLQADDEIVIPQDDLYIISWETNFDDFPISSETDNIHDDQSTYREQQDDIITDLDLRSTRRQTDTDATYNDTITRETADADLRSARRQTNTDTDNTEPYSNELHDEDRQSFRQQINTDSKNTEMATEDSSDDGNSDSSTYGGNDVIVSGTLDKENDELDVENENSRGGKYNLRPNPTPNYTE